MADGRPHGQRKREKPSRMRAWLLALLSLQFKATALVVILTLSVTAAVSGFLLQTSGTLARSQHGDQLVQLASILSTAASPLVSDSSHQQLQALADESADGSPLLFVVFTDAEGHQLARSEQGILGDYRNPASDSSGGSAVPGTPVFRTGQDGNGVFLEATYPIVRRAIDHRGKSKTPILLIGYVRAGMLADGWQESMASTLDLLIGVGILATACAIPLGFLLVHRIVSPLDGLASAMLRFSEGDLDVRREVGRKDELGRLAMAFNRMADQHQYTHERIVRLNAELEKRVAQRTQQLRELASREPLTSLYNRRFFNEMLERRFAEASRYGTDLSCLMIDLDGFKRVNDEFGHQIGDDLLVLTGETIASQLRTADVAARFGGDEFIVLLPHTDPDQSRVLAERIAEKFAENLSEQFPRVEVSMSIGIASLPALDISDVDCLVHTADHALYEAKAAGKNRVVTAESASKPASV